MSKNRLRWITLVRGPIWGIHSCLRLRYNVRANIMPDQEFKDDIGSIRKKAEQALVGALAKFHQRRAERLNSKIKKLQQVNSRREEIVTRKQPSSKADSTARKSNVNFHENVNQLAEVLKTKMGEVDKLLVKLKTQAKNKESESYPCLLSGFLKVREMGKTNTNTTKAVRNCKRKERKRDKDRKNILNNIESRKQHIKNLSNQELTDKQIILTSRGLKFIPTFKTRENLIRRQLLTDFNQFARQMRLQYIYRGERNKPHPFHVKSNWVPPVQPSVALETFLEEVKFELADIEIHRPKDNLSHNERRALKELSRDKNIVL